MRPRAVHIHGTAWGAHMPTHDLKAKVREYWGKVSCGEIYAVGATPEECFSRQEETRYQLEPYIRQFARFQEGAGEDVLEVGVGMGADHLQWARGGPRRLAA